VGAARVGRELSEAAARLHSIFAQAAEVTQLPAEHVGRCQAILAAGMQAAASQLLELLTKALGEVEAAMRAAAEGVVRGLGGAGLGRSLARAPTPRLSLSRSLSLSLSLTLTPPPTPNSDHDPSPDRNPEPNPHP